MYQPQSLLHQSQGYCFKFETNSIEVDTLLNPQFLLLFLHGLDLGLFPFLDLNQELFVFFQALLQALDMVDQALVTRVAIPIAALDFGGVGGGQAGRFDELDLGRSSATGRKAHEEYAEKQAS